MNDIKSEVRSKSGQRGPRRRMTGHQVAAVVFAIAAFLAGVFRILIGITHGDGLLALVWLFGLAAVIVLWHDALADRSGR